MNALNQWFARPQWLWLLAVLPALGLLALWARRQRRRALIELGTGTALAGMRARRSDRIKALAGLLGYVLLVVGIAGPQWGRDWSQSVVRGRDLVVVVDVSRSMLAENPSRLERAQRVLRDIHGSLKATGRHRLGLVVFARHARLVCPLTNDYDLFLESVESIDAEHLDPQLRPKDFEISGTCIGEAITTAVDAHRTDSEDDSRRRRRGQDILLISDGDDPASDSPERKPEWQDGVEAARARGIPVHVVGVGDPSKGWPIPFKHFEVVTLPVFGVVRVPRDYQRHAGRDVQTWVNEATLDTIARRTDGQYIALKTGDYQIGQLYLNRLSSGDEREHGEDLLPVYYQHYAWFLTPAFGLLGLTLLLGDGRRVGAYT